MVRSERRGLDGPICTGKTDCPIWFRRYDLKRTRPVAGGSPEIGFYGGASPELVEINAPGVKSNGAWVRRDQRDTRDPPESLAGLGGARGHGRDGGGRSRRRSSSACAVLA
jgi:hypothetical protein